jgi:hypothetical protein
MQPKQTKPKKERHLLNLQIQKVSESSDFNTMRQSTAQFGSGCTTRKSSPLRMRARDKKDVVMTEGVLDEAPTNTYNKNQSVTYDELDQTQQVISDYQLYP